MCGTRMPSLSAWIGPSWLLIVDFEGSLSAKSCNRNDQDTADLYCSRQLCCLHQLYHVLTIMNALIGKWLRHKTSAKIASCCLSALALIMLQSRWWVTSIWRTLWWTRCTWGVVMRASVTVLRLLSHCPTWGRTCSERANWYTTGRLRPPSLPPSSLPLHKISPLPVAQKHVFHRTSCVDRIQRCSDYFFNSLVCLYTLINAQCCHYLVVLVITLDEKDRGEGRFRSNNSHTMQVNTHLVVYSMPTVSHASLLVHACEQTHVRCFCYT